MHGVQICMYINYIEYVLDHVCIYGVICTISNVNVQRHQMMRNNIIHHTGIEPTATHDQDTSDGMYIII